MRTVVGDTHRGLHLSITTVLNHAVLSTQLNWTGANLKLRYLACLSK